MKNAYLIHDKNEARQAWKIEQNFKKKLNIRNKVRKLQFNTPTDQENKMCTTQLTWPGHKTA